MLQRAQDATHLSAERIEVSRYQGLGIMDGTKSSGLVYGYMVMLLVRMATRGESGSFCTLLC